ncbi:hypothetical protein ANO11243_030460 [Dothideomycetidae sp. 11243]|nr:hypothetical protein ANO11243_030460 [fungal sp. No.11243]
MASPDTQNEVVNSQSVDGHSSIDAHAQHSSVAFAANGIVHPPPTSDPISLHSKHDVERAAHLREIHSHDHEAGSEEQTSVSGLGADHSSVADTASVQGSVADVDPTRDTGSVTDAFDPGAGGSDTDTSRADTNEQKEGSGIRSAKKPALFKAVSVTRSFLAKTASASVGAKVDAKQALANLAQGPSPALARPRLVAKSGSGLRDSPRPRSGADSPADGTTVWNKNRPAPPPPTKHFTDEELKQQYGIHLASRIQADDSNKQSKWADMDDEDDDWAPETVEWMDGTKSTINPEPLPSQPVKAAPVDQPPPPESKPAVTVIKRTILSGPPKTVLRPGAAQQAKQDLANAKESLDSNGSKASAPVPAKSPWAILPPVDKSAPIADYDVLNPPPPRQTLGSQDARMMDGSFSASTAREMEADTFDRTWRDSDRGPRELFNSQSGRYEPAPEGRRGSMRREQGYRQPSVLQRPSQSDNSEAIVEPYQARGAQMDGSSWSRRRGSSISAQSVQPLERRVSISQKALETGSPAENRTGIVIGHDIGPLANQTSPKQASKALPSGDDRNEELLRQKKIMQEKRELAIRRRKEEEEKEEAAKRERIRLKLESLGMAAVPSKSNSSVSPAQPPTQGEIAQPQASTEKAPTIPASSPEHSVGGANQQLALSPAKAQPLSAVHSDPGSQPRAVADRLDRSPQPATDHRASQKARSPNIAPPRAFQDHSAISSKAPTSSYSSPGDSKAQPAFKSPGLSADTFATWGSRAGQVSNVQNLIWGPPVSAPSRHIGNGAFDTSFSRIPHRLQNHNMDLGQNASFPPSSHQTARSPSAGTRQETSPMRHQQMLSDLNLAALGLVDSPGETFPLTTSAGPSPLLNEGQTMPLSPIAPPPRPAQAAPGFQQPPQHGSAQWSQFSAQPPHGDSGRRELEPTVRQVSRSHLSGAQNQQPQQQQQWKETFKQTKETMHVAHALTDRGHSDPAPPITHTQQPAAVPIPGAQSRESTVRLPDAHPNSLSSGTTTARVASGLSSSATAGQHQSRFFPSSLHGGSPPPEETGHPVYSGSDVTRPKVSFPTPKPHVRLPPAAIAATLPPQPSPVTMPERVPSHRSGSQPLVQSSDWQARFNGLFGRIPTTTAGPPSPPKTPPKRAIMPSPAPLSSSKAEVFEIGSGRPATVSLPFQGSTSSSIPEMTSKPTVDDIFDGELSFGSTPKVSVPRSPSYHPGPDRNGIHILRMRPIARFDKPVDPLSRQAAADDGSSTRSISIHLPFSRTITHELPQTQAKRIMSEIKPRKTSVKSGKSPKIGTDDDIKTPSPVPSPVIKGDRKFSHTTKSTRGPKPSKIRQPSGKPQTPA